MEQWELVARESIRDLVARYNAQGDSGRLDALIELFAPDAEMVVVGTSYVGHEAIRGMFTATVDDVRAQPAPLLRHFTATLQIDVESPDSARSRAYYAVLMAHGLDHWGRYLDTCRVVDGAWRFARREVLLDGAIAGGWAASRQ